MTVPEDDPRVKDRKDDHEVLAPLLAIVREEHRLRAMCSNEQEHEVLDSLLAAARDAAWRVLARGIDARARSAQDISADATRELHALRQDFERARDLSAAIASAQGVVSLVRRWAAI